MDTRLPDGNAALQGPATHESGGMLGHRWTGEAIEPGGQVRLGGFWVPIGGLFALVAVEMRQ